MKWFEGSIVDAVATSKKRSAFFVVFIEGKDELSSVMSSALNRSDVSEQLGSDKFVSIKLDSESESYKQFSEIYKLVPIPSVFFIGQNGSPLEIVTGETAESGVLTKLEAAIHKCTPNKSGVEATLGNSKSSADSTSSMTGPSTSQMTSLKSEPIAEPKPASTSEPVPQASSASVAQPPPSEDNISSTADLLPPAKSQDVNSKHDKTSNLPNAPATSPTPMDCTSDHPHETELPTPVVSSEVSAIGSLSIEEKVERAKQLLEKKKEMKKAQEEQEEKDKELERRKTGQAIMEAKKRQQEREILELKEERKREKMEEKAAKQRILDQIALDRAERAARNSVITAGEVSTSTASAEPQARSVSSPNIDANTARLQFKMPDGQTRTHTFPAETTLGQVRQFIDNNIVLPFREYQMATTFPRREFTFRDIDSDLRTLELLPSAVILIMPVQGVLRISRGGGWSQAMVNMVWNLVQPLLSLSRYLKSLVWGDGGNDNAAGTSRHNQGEPAASHNPNPRLAASSNSRTVRKRGNIHSLGDADNSNDENNTWNGNSTQQM